MKDGTKAKPDAAELVPELLQAIRDLVGLPALWGSTAARPVVERARALLARAEGKGGP
jgi:hypothetical protein